MSDISKLLKSVINLIAKDVKEIQALSNEGKLPHLASQDLVRYSGALLSLQESLENTDKKTRANLQQLTTQELEELAKKALQEE